jgi:hypothetical protein
MIKRGLFSLLFFSSLSLLALIFPTQVKAQCATVNVYPNKETVTNTITITSDEFRSGNTYKIRIWVDLGGAFGIGRDFKEFTAVAEGNTVTIQHNPFDKYFPANKNLHVELLYANGEIICAQNDAIRFNPGNDCVWKLLDSTGNESINKPIKDGNYQLRIESPITQLLGPHGSNYSIIFRKPNGERLTVSPIAPTGAYMNYNFIPSQSGIYKVEFKVQRPHAGWANYCSAEIDIGIDSNNPGRGIIGEGEGDSQKKYPCPEDNDLCKQCFDKDGVWTALGCIEIGSDSLNDFVGWVLSRVIFVASGIAFLLMVYGAIQIITSSGSPDQVKAGKELITGAVAGLILIILTLFILRLIGVDILHIPGFSS